MNHRRSSSCRLDLLLTPVCCALLTACVGATRLLASTRGPAGSQIQKKELDMTFLEAPSVHREDVTSKLASIDTCYKHPHLFWGRWADSRWGYWWFLADGKGGAGDAKRVWHVKNLLVAFDDNGVHAKTRSHRQRPRTLAGIAHLCRPDACARSFQAPLPRANFGLLLRHFASGLPGGHGQEERPGPCLVLLDHSLRPRVLQGQPPILRRDLPHSALLRKDCLRTQIDPLRQRRDGRLPCSNTCSRPRPKPCCGNNAPEWS